MEKPIQGVVEQILGKRILVRTRSAAKYDVDVSKATLTRKNGLALELVDVLAKDKVEVFGEVFGDHSVLASAVRDLSVTPRKVTLSGKVESVDTAKESFQLYTNLFGLLTIYKDKLTVLKGASLNIIPGVRVKVKGLWERPKAPVRALELEVKLRKVKLEITGELVIRTPDSLTVVADGVIYGVDIRSAKLLSQRRRVISSQDLPMGSFVKVTGKHISESTAVEASQVRVIK